MSQFRPLNKDNIPPEGATVLVRFNKKWKATPHRVSLAEVIYRQQWCSDAPSFAGFRLLSHRAPSSDYDDYLDRMVEVFDGWMICPE